VVAIVPIPSMVMSSMIMSSMGVMGVSSRVWGIAGLLLSSGVVLPLAILPLGRSAAPFLELVRSWREKPDPGS
jgi:hypothetical protein